MRSHIAALLPLQPNAIACRPAQQTMKAKVLLTRLATALVAGSTAQIWVSHLKTARTESPYWPNTAKQSEKQKAK